MSFQEKFFKFKEYVSNQPLWKKVAVLFVVVFFLISSILTYSLFLSSPTSYPVGTIYTIKPNISLGEIAYNLESKNIIRSAFFFKVVFVMYYGGDNLNYGDYSLGQKENIFQIASRLANRDYRLKTFKITIPEGLNRNEIADLIQKNRFDNFNKEDFLDQSKIFEGYLFPSTYFWSENVSTKEIIDKMKSTFQTQTQNFLSSASNNQKNSNDIIKMASIIELEANNDTDRKIISDILWRRLKLGMPLQVNSTLKYINEKNTLILTIDQTKIDSPYNTYKYKGFPPTPVSNPGLASIKAALNPTPNKFLYFLTGDDGKMYYAKTYEEHLLNKKKYLK